MRATYFQINMSLEPIFYVADLADRTEDGQLPLQVKIICADSSAIFLPFMALRKRDDTTSHGGVNLVVQHKQSTRTHDPLSASAFFPAQPFVAVRRPFPRDVLGEPGLLFVFGAFGGRGGGFEP